MSRANETSQMFNMRCMCGKEANDESFREYQGGRVRFCSPECADKWDHFQDENKRELLERDRAAWRR